MPFASKSQQREARSMDVTGADKIVTSDSAPELNKMPKDKTTLGGGSIGGKGKGADALKGGAVGGKGGSASPLSGSLRGKGGGK